MKYKYLPNLPDYAVGENEKLYSDMAAKGWHLVKRGAYFSKFKKGEKQDRIYRVEFASQKFMDTSDIPDEKLEYIEESGWEYVTGQGIYHVFSAPGGAEVKEIHTDTALQADALKPLKRAYLGSLPAVLITIVLYFILIKSLGRGSSIVYSAAEGLYKSTALSMAYLLFLVYSVYSLIYGAVRSCALVNKLKRGEKLDHSPKNKHLVHGTIKVITTILVAVNLILTLVQLFTIKKYDMPQVADDMYFTFSDMGINGERVDRVFGIKKDSSVEISTSLICRMVSTYEAKNSGGRDLWMYQNIYEFKSEKLADLFFGVIKENGEFSRYNGNDLPLEWSDYYDDAWIAKDLEYIVRKGNVVYDVTLLQNGEITDETVLETIKSTIE